MSLRPSELILNPDGSIYHLNLLPQDVSNTIITVGDPDRVETVSKYFDTIELRKQKREFNTHTGIYKGKRLTVISTGIGTDNIDIVLNELDALVNIDFKSRKINSELKQLNVVRLGTSGAIQENIKVDSFLISELCVGFDSLLHYYKYSSKEYKDLIEALMIHLNWDAKKSEPYIVSSDKHLLNIFAGVRTVLGVTGTNIGFYGPQSRKLRLDLKDETLNDKLASFKYNKLRLTNLEMETAGIYGLSKLLGHRAISLNAIIANRSTGKFSNDHNKTMKEMIEYALERILHI